MIATTTKVEGEIVTSGSAGGFYLLLLGFGLLVTVFEVMMFSIFVCINLGFN